MCRGVLGPGSFVIALVNRLLGGRAGGGVKWWCPSVLGWENRWISGVVLLAMSAGYVLFDCSKCLICSEEHKHEYNLS